MIVCLSCRCLPWACVSRLTSCLDDSVVDIGLPNIISAGEGSFDDIGVALRCSSAMSMFWLLFRHFCSMCFTVPTILSRIVWWWGYMVNTPPMTNILKRFSSVLRPIVTDDRIWFAHQWTQCTDLSRHRYTCDRCWHLFHKGIFWEVVCCQQVVFFTNLE